MGDFDIEAMRADAAAGTKGPWRYEPVLSFRGDEILGHAVMGANAGHELLYWDADDDPSQAADARRMGRVTDMEAEIERLRAENDAMQRDISILLGSLDYLQEATGETLDAEDSALVEQIRRDVAARAALGDRP